MCVYVCLVSMGQKKYSKMQCTDSYFTFVVFINSYNFIYSNGVIATYPCNDYYSLEFDAAFRTIQAGTYTYMLAYTYVHVGTYT